MFYKMLRMQKRIIMESSMTRLKAEKKESNRIDKAKYQIPAVIDLNVPTHGHLESYVKLSCMENTTMSCLMLYLVVPIIMLKAMRTLRAAIRLIGV